MAGATALSTRKPFVRIWREGFLWTAPGFIVAGSAGAVAAIIVARGAQWRAILMLAPVLLTYHTYKMFVGRLQDQRRHVIDTHRHHRRTLQALDLVQRERVDVLLADIGMPGEDGYTLVKRIRALSSPRLASIPAAALTAFARDEDRQQAFQAGFQAHIPKPVDVDLLVTAVANLGRLSLS